MTDLLEQAIMSLRDLPAETQDDLARMLLQFAGVDQPSLELDADDDAWLGASLDEAERGAFATDEKIRAIWAKHSL